MRVSPRFALLALGIVRALAGCGDDRPGAGGGGGSGGGGGGGGGGMTGAMPDGIVVDTPSGRVASDSADGYCDIFEAIAAAAAGQSVRECANPKGSSRIILTGGARYPVARTLRFSSTTGQPLRFAIAGSAGTTDGTTAGSATISAAEPWLLDPGDAHTGCLVHVSGGAIVELSGVTLTQPPSLSLSGACVTNGSLSFRNGRVTGFRRSGMIATCLPETGCDFARDDLSILLVAGSLVDGNATSEDGGGIYSAGFGAVLVVYHSSIVNNTAAGAGGGLYYGGGWNTHVVRASTVSGNKANVGGGVMVKFACSNTYLNVFNSTIADNTAEGSGGGIQFEPASKLCSMQDVTLYSSIVAGNHSLSTRESNINAGWWTDDPDGDLGIFVCFRGSFVYVAPGFPRPTEVEEPCLLTTRDPRLGPLTPMGGTGNLPVHPLLPGSPAIDRVQDHSYDDQRDAWITDVDLPPATAWSVFDRMADGDGDGRLAADYGAVEMSPRWQTELLSIATKGSSPHRVVVTPAGFDRGAGTEYAAKSAARESVTYRLPIAMPGFYDLTAGVLRTPTGGRFQIAVADQTDGTWTDIGTVQDGFAQSPAFVAFGPFASPFFATAGEKLIRFTVTGKNAASGGYGLSLDYIDARRSTKACPAAQISSGANHVCALTEGGGVRCWGGNASGQLGDGTTTAAWRAPVIDAVIGANAVAAGARHTCALTAAGGVRCWGANNLGQLGDGTTTERHTPPAADALAGVKAIAAGANHTCALTAAGGVRCWGANIFGQLGDGTTTERHTPPAADALAGVKAIAAGANHTCALTTAGGVRCWGANIFGQLGDGTTADRATPPGSDVLADVASLSVGSGHTCAVTTAGGVRCWGSNSGGQLGNGTFGIEVLAPPDTDVLAGAREVAAGASFTCALMKTGGVRCWGYNSDGQLGDETPNATERLAPAPTDILADVNGLGVGSAHTCALMKTGGVRCWGANGAGQLGDGLAPDPSDTPPPLDIVDFSGTCR